MNLLLFIGILLVLGNSKLEEIFQVQLINKQNMNRHLIGCDFLHTAQYLFSLLSCYSAQVTHL